MEKVNVTTGDLTQGNIRAIANLFPSVVTEALSDSGELVLAVDFDLLRQELSANLVDGPRERFQLDWPGKRASALVANVPTSSTLRPILDRSIEFETTRNLFIEGDNLEALKILQESYLGKVKLIYIDPPYNTGNDFIYEDDFSESVGGYLQRTGQSDYSGTRLIANTESNGRFHSDWLSMMYPRLKLARSLLTEDGFILISIDSHEAHNLRKICDEVFGEACYKNTIAVRRGIKNVQAQFEDLSSLSQGHEYILMYSRSVDARLPKLSVAHEETRAGKWDTFWRGTDRPTMRYELFGETPNSGQWRWEERRAKEAARNYQEFLEQSQNVADIDDYYIEHLMATNVKLNFVRQNSDGVVQYYVPPSAGKLLSDNWMDLTLSGNATDGFETEKSLLLMNRIVGWLTNGNDIVMDFFAGSGTTGHAVMDSNFLDNQERRYVLVQIGEEVPDGSRASAAGFAKVSDLCSGRLQGACSEYRAKSGGTLVNVDAGFRYLRVASSNFAEHRMRPDSLAQTDLLEFADNIVSGRTSEDLLFQVLLEWGLELSLPIQIHTLAGAEVWNVDDGALLACFEATLSMDLVRAIAERAPLRAVFRDSSFESDAERINVEQIFRELSRDTQVKVI